MTSGVLTVRIIADRRIVSNVQRRTELGRDSPGARAAPPRRGLTSHRSANGRRFEFVCNTRLIR